MTGARAREKRAKEENFMVAVSLTDVEKKKRSLAERVFEKMFLDIY